MSTAKAALVESINKRHLRGLPSRTKTGQTNGRLKKMRDLASELLEESEALEHEGELAEASATIATLSTNTAINFFEEVRQFEVRLINRALELAGGNQATRRAAAGTGNDNPQLQGQDVRLALVAQTSVCDFAFGTTDQSL